MRLRIPVISARTVIPSLIIIKRFQIMMYLPRFNSLLSPFFSVLYLTINKYLYTPTPNLSFAHMKVENVVVLTNVTRSLEEEFSSLFHLFFPSESYIIIIMHHLSLNKLGFKV